RAHEQARIGVAGEGRLVVAPPERITGRKPAAALAGRVGRERPLQTPAGRRPEPRHARPPGGAGGEGAPPARGRAEAGGRARRGADVREGGRDGDRLERAVAERAGHTEKDARDPEVAVAPAEARRRRARRSPGQDVIREAARRSLAEEPGRAATKERRGAVR